MNEIARTLIARVGADLAKRVIQVHAVGGAGRRVVSRALKRDQFDAWCASLPVGCLVAMEACSGANAPDAITLREVKVGHQVLVTTLLDHRRVSKADLSALYARRWNVELDLRNLKTTTGMDVQTCQTPTMNDKQLWVHLLAYNVIRLLMAQAACNANVDSRRLSFKHTVQLWTERGWHQTATRCASASWARVFMLLPSACAAMASLSCSSGGIRRLNFPE